MGASSVKLPRDHNRTQIIEPVFRAGETYPFSTEITEEEAYTAWIDTPSPRYIAEDEHNNVVGTY